MPWIEPTPEKRHGLLHIRTDAGKYLFYSRLAINERTADGYVHLPMSSTPPCKRVRWGFFLSAGKRLLIRSSDRYGSEPRQFGNRGRFLQSVRRFAGSEPGAGAGSAKRPSVPTVLGESEKPLLVLRRRGAVIL
jgi:hypothetical protein